jgi:hypothetical protein
MDRHGSVQSLLAELCEQHENRSLVRFLSLDESSALHPGELVGEPAFVPSKALGEGLLAHIAFANAGEAGQNCELWAGKTGRCCEVTPDAGQYVLAHKAERMPDTKFLRRQQIIWHRDYHPNKNELT